MNNELALHYSLFILNCALRRCKRRFTPPFSPGRLFGALFAGTKSAEESKPQVLAARRHGGRRAALFVRASAGCVLKKRIANPGS
ncbi:hypothetical protein [uncultured Alistipes sp.]|uniref:hypothetical protein n=1 Tax=uncultured Alistipes sp. TaxID=538949 RepID=UPI00262D5808|nr:hypothetical protein [uncultured Alistipes sp.]